MFVTKWEPDVTPTKPELTEAPIWLELRQVPFQFFNEDGLEQIASLVGDPKFLHPATANKINLEVAKVFTIIDPREPLPEAVNIQFETGEICRVLVSSSWMPPICGHCKEIGHSSRRCKLAPITCIPCKSSTHSPHNCPKSRATDGKGRKTRRAKPKEKKGAIISFEAPVTIEQATQYTPGIDSGLVTGECSNSNHLKTLAPNFDAGATGAVSEASTGLEPDSSEIESSEEDEEEGEIRDLDDFRLVRKKHFRHLKDVKGKGPEHA